jgi:CBS domain-containing protein
MGKSIRDAMTANPRSVGKDATVVEAARSMRDEDAGIIPIVDGDQLVGTITDRDIAIRVVAKGLDPKSARLSDFGGNEVICCAPEDDVEQARQAMQQHKIQRILVCDAQKKPVGVISLQDLAQSEGEHEVGETVRSVKEEGATAHH